MVVIKTIAGENAMWCFKKSKLTEEGHPYRDLIERLQKNTATREDIERIICPCCGAKVELRFTSRGDFFILYCSNDFIHPSTNYIAITDPPAWWKEFSGHCMNNDDPASNQDNSAQK